MDLNLDTNAAREAGKLFERITESGAYTGRIVRAEIITSEKGTTGLELTIDTPNGKADYLTMWMVNKNGEEIYGMKAVQALMVCLKLRNCPEGQITCDKWDDDSRKPVPTKVMGYPLMMNKEVGVVLQRELYTKISGGEGEKLQIVTFFDPITRMVAAEILDKAPVAKQLDKAIAWLERSPVKDSRTTKSYVPPVSSHREAGKPVSGSFTDFDDDIPF
jgi:hypothetical protein